MTEKEYYTKVKLFGLHPVTEQTYRNAYGEPFSIPRASDLTPEQRVAVIEQLRKNLGIEFGQ
jgi:hypothetical protein